MSSINRVNETGLIARPLKVTEIEEFLHLLEVCELTFAPTDSKEAYTRALESGVDAIIVVEYEKQIVGGIVVKYSILWSIVSHLCVDPDFRRLGIAGKLIEAAESKIEELGGTEVIVSYIACNNRSSLNLSDKKGFVTWLTPVYCVYKEV